MEDRWTDRLSEYLDGELGASEREELDRHLAGCAACAATLTELRAVVGRLAALPDVGPTHDLWPAIEARLEAAPRLEASGDTVISLAARRRRFSFTVPQLAAAGIAVIALSSGIAWLIASGGLRSGGPAGVAVVGPGRTPPAATSGAPATNSAGQVAFAPVQPAGNPAGAGGGESAQDSTPVSPRQPRAAASRTHLVSAPLTRKARAERDYERAVGDLETVLRSERSHLKPETVAALQKSLADIDRALADARRALARDPGNVYLNAHLAETMRLKLEFLREAASLTQS